MKRKTLWGNGNAFQLACLQLCPCRSTDISLEVVLVQESAWTVRNLLPFLNSMLVQCLHLSWATVRCFRGCAQRVSRMTADIRERWAFGMHLASLCFLNFSVCLLSLNLKPRSVISVLLVCLQSWVWRGEDVFMFSAKCSPEAVEKTFTAPWQFAKSSAKHHKEPAYFSW